MKSIRQRNVISIFLRISRVLHRQPEDFSPPAKLTRPSLTTAAHESAHLIERNRRRLTRRDFRQGFECMAVGHLEAHRDATVSTSGCLKLAFETGAPSRRTQALKARRRGVAAEAAQFVEHGARRGP